MKKKQNIIAESSQHTEVIHEDAQGITESLTVSSKKKRKRTPAGGFVSGIPADFVFTDEFAQAFSAMEDTRENLFITGRAGSGKSTLLHYFKEHTKKNIVVVAPTGVAAINIGGTTIHSFFQFPTRLITRDDIKAISYKRKVFASLDTIIIDEVSMVRADILDAIDYSLRINRNAPLEPFGGVQVILIGDLYQLPPVVEQSLKEYFSLEYASPFFFSASVLNEIALKKIVLQKIFRQSEERFIELLNRVRENSMTFELLHELNKRYHTAYEQGVHDIAITLCGTNQLASSINQEQLRALRYPEFSFTATVLGAFDKGSFPSDEELFLKKGAQVMMVKNDPAKRWVNGSLGIIEHVSEDEIIVSFGDEAFPVEKVLWEQIEYEYFADERKIVPVVTGTFQQYPIKLAWAITIHKSQGKTFDNVIIDFGRGAFAHGQAYVALSRCRTLEGIRLKTPLRRTDIMLDSRVKQYLGEEAHEDEV